MVALDGDEVAAFVEKPAPGSPSSNRINAGACVGQRPVVERLRLGGNREAGRPARGACLMGSEEGRLLAIDRTSHRTIWEYQIPGDVAINQILAMPDQALVVASDGRLSVVGLRDGAVEASVVVDGQITSGPVIGGDRAFLTMKQKVGRDTALDVLLALDARKLEILWEYRDGGAFSTSVAASGTEVLLGNAQGQILRFR